MGKREEITKRMKIILEKMKNTEKEKVREMERSYEQTWDVAVAGGGVSGTAAAIAAARCGARVLILEQNGYLGGTLTGCGVGPMMTFHAGETQVIKGIMEEIVQRLVKRGYSAGHVHDTTRYISYLTPFSAEGLKLILDEMTEEAGCEVLFHTFIGEVETEGNRITGLTVCNKDGLNRIKAKVVIDATGDGDIAAFAGAPMTKGRPEDGAAQPMTMKMKFCHVDSGRLRSYLKEHVGEFSRLVRNQDLLNGTEPLAVAGFEKEFEQAKAAGEIEIPREDILFFETNRPGEFIINTTRIIDHDATSAASLSDAERVGRKQCEQLERFLKKYVPGFENALLEFTGPSVGVRGSRQLKGDYMLTAEDILERRPFDRVIAHSAYPIDIHNPKGQGTSSHFLSEPGTYYSIPYDVLTCPSFSNLLVTGRCLSATFEAQAAIRVTPTVGAIGHAAGIAAAQAAKEDLDVHDVDVPKVQRILKEQGAFISDVQ